MLPFLAWPQLPAFHYLHTWDDEKQNPKQQMQQRGHSFSAAWRLVCCQCIWRVRLLLRVTGQDQKKLEPSRSSAHWTSEELVGGPSAANLNTAVVWQV